jgi:hypothetical protein
MLAGIDRLRRALDSHNNYLAAKAAKIVEDQNLTVLYAEVRAAYERFFIDPITADPQCWAKNALVKTLVKLGCRESQVYLRGLRHHQNEPVWGGQADTAAELRGHCVQALLTCRELGAAELLGLAARATCRPRQIGPHGSRARHRPGRRYLRCACCSNCASSSAKKTRRFSAPVSPRC